MIDIEERWSLDDIADAHAMLDVYDRIQARQQADLEANRPKK